MELRYGLRRVDCRRCGVTSEWVPWASPGSWFTDAFRADDGVPRAGCGQDGRLGDDDARRVGDRRRDHRTCRRAPRQHRPDRRPHAHRHRRALVPQAPRVHHRGRRSCARTHRLGRTREERGHRARLLRGAWKRAVCTHRGCHDRHVAGVHRGGVRVGKERADRLRPLPRPAPGAGRALDQVRRAEVRQDRRPRRTTRAQAIRASPCRRTRGTSTPWSRASSSTSSSTNRRLYRAYLLKETLAAILDRRQPWIARDKLFDWIQWARRSQLPPFKKAAATIRDHLDGIVAYVATGLSNGPTEGLNGKARTITRRSFGFHSATSLISMLFLCCAGLVLQPAHVMPRTHST